MNRVYLSLGSNIKPRANHLQQARTLLADQLTITEESPLYETEPLGPGDQSWHINQVISVDTEMTPEQLLSFVLFVEKQLGRQKREKWGPREIDIDILLYNSAVIDIVETPKSASLFIPHLELPNRKFILRPLADIAGDNIEPRSGLTVQALLEACPDRLQIKIHNR